MKKATFSLLFLFLCSVNYLHAQNQYGLTSGKIVFEISYMDDRLDAQTKAMMPTETIMYFKNKKSRVNISMAMGSTSIISDDASKKSTVLMDFMGNKFAMESTYEDNKKEMSKSGEYTVEKLDGSKVIAGYNCKKAKVTQTHKGENISFDVWYSNEIGINNAGANGLEGIEGCMLEYELIQNGTHMKMSTKSISKEDVKDSMFTVPDGYTMTTPEALKSMMGGGR
ncbi:MAG TPA: DUF4412 domain-containing protein [Bacteroidia bacterium]|nr:DUF4412 domain-containing protein [Bacteroidia bacterium]HNS11186.1 DUF4412 domain-containing protein [Bacteroidia bacterium]